MDTMVATTDIRVQNMGVGRVRVDPTQVNKGEGGAADPRLVVVVEVEMYTRPVDQQLALVALDGSLHLTSPAFEANQLGRTGVLDLVRGLPFRTYSTAAPNGSCELRIGLTPAQLDSMERARHASREPRFPLFLRLQGTVAWLRTIEFPTKLGMTESFVTQQMGQVAELWPFPRTEIGDLRIEVEPSTWIEKVLPGLGYDRVRLIEIDLGGMPAEGITASRFDEARRLFDGGRYDDCIRKCRDIRNAWERILNATGKRPVAKVLAEMLDWPAMDWHYRVLDGLWKAFSDATNAPHHAGETPAPLPATADDARLCLVLTLQLSEYVQRGRQRAATTT